LQSRLNGSEFQGRLQVKDYANGNELKVRLDHLLLLMSDDLARSRERGMNDMAARRLRLESHSLKGEISGEA